MAFSVLLLAHVVNDFLFQPEFLVKAKRFSSKHLFFQTYTLVHVLLYLLLTVFLSLIEGVMSPRLFLAALIVTVLHYFIDYWKNLQRNVSAFVFLFDQFLHIVSIILACIITGLWHIPHSWTSIILAFKERNLPLSELMQVNYLLILFVTLIWGSGYFIKTVLSSKDGPRYAETLAEARKIVRRGSFVGYMERIMILLFILNAQYLAIALIPIFKALVRREQLKQEDYAEYFLYDTMLSFTCGILLSSLFRYFFLY